MFGQSSGINNKKELQMTNSNENEKGAHNGASNEQNEAAEGPNLVSNAPKLAVINFTVTYRTPRSRITNKELRRSSLVTVAGR